MIRSYLTVAVRSLMRHRLYAFINVFGLALGIACCLLMALFVEHEWSHDRFHEHRDRIFRLATNEVRTDGGIGHVTLFAPEIPQALTDEVPGVALSTGFICTSDRLAVGERSFRQDIGLVGADFLEMFSFPLVVGDPATALDRPDAIVISELVAHKLFDRVDPGYEKVLGQTITLPVRGLTFVVTGIAAPVPDVSSLDFDALVPIDYHDSFGKSNTGNACMSVYLQLADGQEPREVEAALRSFMPGPLGEYVADRREWNRLQDSPDAFSLQLQPLTDVYWDESIRSHYESRGDSTGVSILSGVAILVLLIACSNYAILSIAQSSGRALEVGIRKVLGANRTQVMQQFWGEALLLSFLGLVLGTALAGVLLPVFNTLIQRDLSFLDGGDGSLLLILTAVATVVGVVAGSYTSLLQSRLEPAAAMKGERRLGGRTRFTHALVALQYSISITLLICTGVMMHQQSYVTTKSLGYDQEHVVVVRTDGRDVAERYRQALLEDPRIMGIALTDRAFTTGSSSCGYLLPDGSRISVRLIGVDPDFLPTLEIDLLEGRNFSDEHPSDRSSAVVINEALARQLGMDDPVGQTLAGFEWNEIKDPTIIGVAADFHMDGLHRAIQPLVLQMRRFMYFPSLLIRVRPGDIPGTVAMLKDTWRSVASGDEAIRLSFLDDNLDGQYREEQRWQRVLTYASAFAIAISCLGLLGLTSLTVARRTKEIGIRKAIGASVQSVVALLSRQFLVMLIVANAIAWPMAYLAMDMWLQRFAYRIELGPGVFALGGAIVVCVALLATSLQTVMAACRNPVEALRYE